MNESQSEKPKRTRWISSWLVNAIALLIIFAVAAAILFPTGMRPREAGRRASCSSNLKRIGLATLQYMQEYDDRFPQRTTGTKPNGEVFSWRDLLGPNLGKLSNSRDLWKCPSNVASKSDSKSLDGWPLGYDIVLGQVVRNGQPLKLSAVKSPASTIMVFEENGDNAQAQQTGALWDKDDGDANWTNIVYAGHLGTSNYLFVDGHVKAMRPLATIADGLNRWNINNKAPVSPRALAKLQAAQRTFD